MTKLITVFLVIFLFTGTILAVATTNNDNIIDDSKTINSSINLDQNIQFVDIIVKASATWWSSRPKNDISMLYVPNKSFA